MATKRQQQVGDMLREEIARILAEEVRDPRIGLVTVTGVEVSADLRVAKVWVTSIGGEGGDSLEAIERAAPFVRRQLAPKLRLRAVPELRFLEDNSTRRGFEIEALLSLENDIATKRLHLRNHTNGGEDLFRRIGRIGRSGRGQPQPDHR